MVALFGKWDLRKVLILTIASLVVTTTSVSAVGLMRGGAPEPTPVAALEDLRQERVIFLERHDAFLVFFRGRALALSSDAQHLGDHVEFCPASGLFEAPAHGEKFDIRGLYLGGPARRGLDRFSSQVHNGWIYVDFTHRIEGPPRGTGTRRAPQGPLCVAN